MEEGAGGGNCTAPTIEGLAETVRARTVNAAGDGGVTVVGPIYYALNCAASDKLTDLRGRESCLLVTKPSISIVLSMK